jgi:hypothetical protein
MDHFSERRMVENELMFRAANRKVQKQLQQDRRRSAGEDTTQLLFYCECSNLNCRDRIKLTVDEYQSAASGQKEFVIISGHENGAVEKVVRKTDAYTVVEKYMDPAKVMRDIV